MGFLFVSPQEYLAVCGEDEFAKIFIFVTNEDSILYIAGGNAMYRYFVIGAGMGRTIAYYLVSQPDTELVVLGDVNFAAAERAVEKICTLLPRHDTIHAVRFDASEPPGQLSFRQFDVVISAVPARYSQQLVRVALNAGVNFCDLGGVVDITQSLLEFDDEAAKSGVSVCLDNGLAPGSAMVFARMLGGHNICVYGGALPQKPEPPLFYQRLYSLEGMEHICYDPVPILKNGEIKIVPPCSDCETLTVPELAPYHPKGKVEAFLTAGCSVAPWTFQAHGFEGFVEKTVRWQFVPGFVSFVKNTPRKKFQETIAPYINIPLGVVYPDLVWLRVESRTSSCGITYVDSMTLFDLFDPQTGLGALERTTGFPAAVMARMIAQGKTKKGVWTPEWILDQAGLHEYSEILKSLFSITMDFVELKK